MQQGKTGINNTIMNGYGCDKSILSHCKKCAKGARIKDVLYFRTTRAKNNFLKHCENNDSKAIERMFKRGSITKHMFK